MHGDQNSPGIIPLAIKDVCSIIQDTPGREFSLRVSYIEIYNEQLTSEGSHVDVEEDVSGSSKLHEEGDFLDELLLGKVWLSDEERVSILLDLLLAGYETTSGLMAFVVYFLSHAPHALQTLQEKHQVLRVRKKEGEFFNWEDYKQMEFTSYVICEALRCGNLVKFLHRKDLQDVKFKESVIPSGWQVLPILSGAHLDPSLHENPFHVPHVLLSAEAENIIPLPVKV